MRTPSSAVLVLLTVTVALASPLGVGCASTNRMAQRLGLKEEVRSPLRTLTDRSLMNADAVTARVGDAAADKATEGMFAGLKRKVFGKDPTGLSREYVEPKMRESRDYLSRQIATRLREGFDSELEFLEAQLNDAVDAVEAKAAPLIALEESVTEIERRWAILKADPTDPANQRMAAETIQGLLKEINANNEVQELYAEAIGYLDVEILTPAETTQNQAADIAAVLRKLEAQRGDLDAQQKTLHELQLRSAEMLKQLTGAYGQPAG